VGGCTGTFYMTGSVIRESNWGGVSKVKIAKVLEQFTGHITQIPPMYSAIKCDGQPLYKLARKGQVIERKPREINVYSLELLTFCPPFVGFKVACSRGTYVRTLADDIGAMLGCGAALKELRRLASGPFSISTSVSLESLEKTARLGSLDALVVTPCAALAQIPEILLSEAAVVHVRHGRSPGWHDVAVASSSDQIIEGALLRLTWNGDLAAVAQYVSSEDAEPRIILKRVFI